MADTITPTPEQTVSPAEVAELRARLARAERRAAEHEARATAAEAERDAERTRATEARIAEAIISAAAEAGLDPELAPRLIDRSLIQVTDEGRVRQPSVTAAVAKFIESRPNFPLSVPRPALKGGTPPRPAPRRPDHPPQGERVNHLGFPVGSVEAAMTERVVPFKF